MRVVCAWCGRWLGGVGRETHTCCPECKQRYFKGGKDAQGLRESGVCEVGKTDKGRHFKRLQLFSNRGAGRAVLYDVTDMGNEEWAFGSEVELPCSITVYQGMRGLGYSLTYWGKGSQDKGVGVAGGFPPPAGDPGPVGGAKSGGKFGG